MFSNSKRISKYEIVSGAYPKTSDEIALASTMQKKYHLGDEISFTQSDEQGILKKRHSKLLALSIPQRFFQNLALGHQVLETEY